MFRSTAQRQTESARNYVDGLTADPALDSIVALAATTLGFAVGQINILDELSMFTIARYGLTDEVALTIPREISNCQFVLDGTSDRAGVVGVADANDPALVGVNADIADRMRAWGARSYLGAPLYGREGVVVGTLCVLDRDVHPLGEYARDTIARFARVVEVHLETRRDRGKRGGSAVSAGTFAAALDAGEVVPHFQPIVDARTGAVVSLETLARWEHPIDGILAPAEFLPAIADSDLMIDLDYAMLTRALEHMPRWLSRNPDLTLNINLSARHLSRVGGVLELHEIVRAAGVEPRSVVFELTETDAHTVGRDSVVFVENLQALGFRVFLDDIGIAWSSLDRLLDLPVNGFKIDSAIAARLGTDRGNALIRSLLMLARDTSQALVVEGIETREVAATAVGLGCSFAQGYLWSRPVPAHEIQV